MNIDIEIYMSGIVKFFKENPEELRSLVPETKKTEFFDAIRQKAIVNSESGDEVSLTRQQLIDICLKINGVKKEIPNDSKLIVTTFFGEYSLN